MHDFFVRPISGKKRLPFSSRPAVPAGILARITVEDMPGSCGAGEIEVFIGDGCDGAEWFLRRCALGGEGVCFSGEERSSGGGCAGESRAEGAACGAEGGSGEGSVGGGCDEFACGVWSWAGGVGVGVSGAPAGGAGCCADGEGCLCSLDAEGAEACGCESAAYSAGYCGEGGLCPVDGSCGGFLDDGVESGADEAQADGSADSGVHQEAAGEHQAGAGDVVPVLRPPVLPGGEGPVVAVAVGLKLRVADRAETRRSIFDFTQSSLLLFRSQVIPSFRRQLHLSSERPNSF